MTERVVCDASAVVALLVDSGPAGRWVTSTVTGASLSAPHLVLFEAANVLRRHELAALLTVDQAVQAHVDLLELPVELWPYDVLSHGAWARRANLSIYDATYVALAELIGATLVTLDHRIARAPGLRCAVAGPPI